MSWAKFSVMGSSRPSLLFSARVSRKFLTTPSLSWLPTSFCSSATICFLSPSVRVGAERTSESFGSFLKTLFRFSRALETGSRVEVLAAAVYCGGWGRPRQRKWFQIVICVVFSLHPDCRCGDFASFSQPSHGPIRACFISANGQLGAIGRAGARETYQSAGVGAIDAVQGNGRLDGLGVGGLGVAPHGDGAGSGSRTRDTGSGGARGARKCPGGVHDGGPGERRWTVGVVGGRFAAAVREGSDGGANAGEKADDLAFPGLGVRAAATHSVHRTNASATLLSPCPSQALFYGLACTSPTRACQSMLSLSLHAFFVGTIHETMRAQFCWTDKFSCQTLSSRKNKGYRSLNG